MGKSSRLSTFKLAHMRTSTVKTYGSEINLAPIAAYAAIGSPNGTQALPSNRCRRNRLIPR